MAIILAVLSAMLAAQPQEDRGLSADGVAPAASDYAAPERDEQTGELKEGPNDIERSDDAGRLSDRSAGIDRGSVGRATSENGADSGFSHRSWWKFWQEDAETQDADERRTQ